jgi:pimeloyl-ACP methyl ester carboxylesterase
MTETNSQLQHHYLDGSPRLHYALTGASDQRTVVLVHGSTQHAGAWDEVAARLTGYHLAALDLRGHGRSDWDGAYSPPDYLSDVTRMVDALDVPRVALIGHSMGSLVSMQYQYASQRPETLWPAGFVDIDAHPPPSQKANLNTAGARTGRTYATLDEARERMKRLRPDADGPVLERMRHAALIEGDDGAFRECYDRETLAQFHAWDNRELLPGIECPSLVLRGAQSTVHGAEAAAEMAEALPNSTFHEIADATHLLHVERPDEVAAVLQRFLDDAWRAA